MKGRHVRHTKVAVVLSCIILALVLVVAGILLWKRYVDHADQGSTVQEPEALEVTGKVIDATMNTLLLETEDGTVITFVTTDASREELTALGLGDTIRVTYLEEKNGQGETYHAATKLQTVAIASGENGEGETSKHTDSTLAALPNVLPTAWQDNGIFSDQYERAFAFLKEMTLEERVGQMLFARCPEENIAREAAAQYHLGGYVLFGRDFKGKTEAQVINTLKSYQATAKIPLAFSVDEEGGAINRISVNPNLAATPFPSPMELYRKGGLEAIQADAVNKAGLLKKLGIQINLGPVADIASSPKDYIFSRTLGAPLEETKQYIGQVVQATQEAGVSCTLKHFPGYGNNVDTHSGISIDQRSYAEFEEKDLRPFISGIDAGVHLVLVSHNVVTCMDAELPASLSPKVHTILRDTLGFTGLILTDDLAMKAIDAYGEKAAPVGAALAGNDLMITTDYAAAYRQLLQAIEARELPVELVNRASMRVLAWKLKTGLL